MSTLETIIAIWLAPAALFVCWIYYELWKRAHRRPRSAMNILNDLPEHLRCECPPIHWKHQIKYEDGWGALGVWLDQYGIEVDDDPPAHLRHVPIVKNDPCGVPTVDAFAADPEVKSIMPRTPHVPLDPDPPFGEPASCTCDFPTTD